MNQYIDIETMGKGVFGLTAKISFTQGVVFDRRVAWNRLLAP